MNFLLHSNLLRLRNIGCLLAAFLPIYSSMAEPPPMAARNLASSPPLINKSGVSSEFGMRIDPFSGLWQEHRGIDLMAKSGTPILATNPGKVSFSGYLPGYGNMVEIDHGSGIATRYGHAERVLVKTGDSVQVSQIIAYVGNSGRTTGPHLHFEVSENNNLINPRNFLGMIPLPSNAYPTLSPFNGKATRVEYITSPQLTKAHHNNIKISTKEIKPRIIYLSKK